MTKFLITFFVMNLVLSVAYFWGIEHNRYICGVLWFVFPMLNCILYGLFENKIEE